MPLKVHWAIPVKIHWTSDTPWNIPLINKHMFENANESPQEHATENTRGLLRCRFPVCDLLPLKAQIYELTAAPSRPSEGLRDAITVSKKA